MAAVMVAVMAAEEATDARTRREYRAEHSLVKGIEVMNAMNKATVAAAAIFAALLFAAIVVGAVSADAADTNAKDTTPCAPPETRPSVPTDDTLGCRYADVDDDGECDNLCMRGAGRGSGGTCRDAKRGRIWDNAFAQVCRQGNRPCGERRGDVAADGDGICGNHGKRGRECRLGYQPGECQRRGQSNR